MCNIGRKRVWILEVDGLIQEDIYVSTINEHNVIRLIDSIIFEYIHVCTW